MKPDLVDTKLFDYDIQKIDIKKHSFILNISLVLLLFICIWLIFGVFKSPISKERRQQEIIKKLRNILITSDKHIQHRNMIYNITNG